MVVLARRAQRVGAPLMLGAASGIEVRVLMTGLQTDRLALLADVLDVVAVVAYLAGMYRLEARGRRWPRAATVAFLAGVGSIWVAVGSGLANYDDVNPVVHVIQHGLLMMVAAPLLAAGKPITLASQAASRHWQVRLLRVVHSQWALRLTHPVVGWSLYIGSMYACFLDHRVYAYLVDHPLAHDASHVLVLVVGYLFWQPLVGGDPSRRRLSHRTRMKSMLTATTAEVVLGLVIMVMTEPLSPGQSLGQTHAAGLTLVFTCVLTCVMTRISPERRLVIPQAATAVLEGV